MGTSGCVSVRATFFDEKFYVVRRVVRPQFADKGAKKEGFRRFLAIISKGTRLGPTVRGCAGKRFWRRILWYQAQVAPPDFWTKKKKKKKKKKNDNSDTTA